MKEQVSMMRSAWAVVTSWRRWARSREGAERRLGSSWVSGFEAFPDELGCEWLSGVVMFGWGKGVRMVGRGVGRRLDLGEEDSTSIKNCRDLWHQQSGHCSNQHLGHIGMFWRGRHGCSVEYGMAYNANDVMACAH